MDSQVSLRTRRKISMLRNRGLWSENLDMQMNVLSRLSTKQLMRLKLVCKGWNDLILDRTFAHFQLKETETVSGFFFQESRFIIDDDLTGVRYAPFKERHSLVYDTVLKFLPENVAIQASCNGLICCQGVSPASSVPMIYVCNPLRRKELRKLQSLNPDGVCSLALAFDPFRNPVDVPTNFKVIAVQKVEEDSQLLFDVYSSETGEWRKCVEVCNCEHGFIKNKGIFVGGDLYWLTDGDEILMLNLENEMSFLIKEPLPTVEFTTRPQFCIGESGGRLHYILMSEHGLQMWMLEDCFTSQWVLKNSISLYKLEVFNSPILDMIAVKLKIIIWLDLLAFKDNILLMRVSDGIYNFDFKTVKMKMLCQLSDLGPMSTFSPCTIPYSMSLVPLPQSLVQLPLPVQVDHTYLF